MTSTQLISNSFTVSSMKNGRIYRQPRMENTRWEYGQGYIYTRWKGTLGFVIGKRAGPWEQNLYPCIGK